MSLIHLSPAGSGLSPALLESPGGFVWWYLDLVDTVGNGLVIIWSFGLPFLPGYAASARDGAPQTPGARPSLNVATYKEGKLDYYLLQEYDIKDVRWSANADGDTWHYGECVLTSVEVDGTRRVHLDLRLDLPRHGGLTHIDIQATGPARRDVTPHEHSGPDRRQEAPLPNHDWTPLLGASPGRATITHEGSHTREILGRVYHDRNGGCRPLHDLNIDIWVWGRVALADSELIYYVLDAKDGTQTQSEAIFLEIGNDGSTTYHEHYRLIRGTTRRNLGGLRWWPKMIIERGDLPTIELDHGDVVDSGPFYMRSVLRALSPEGTLLGRGISEVCDPDRIDLAIHRPLVRMRVRHYTGDHSMWTPLFCGARDGRVRRLFQSFLPGS